MIVKNEEDILAQCLESAKPWVDEIVIVDTGSTDATKSIAASFGALIYDFPWIDDFSAARNFSLSKATGDWILWLDADDVLPEETGSKLRSLITTANSEFGSFLFKYHDHNFGAYSTLQRSSLFRRDSKFRFKGVVHEQLEILGYKYFRTDLPIIHSVHGDEISRLQKNKFYLKLLRKDIEINPDSASSFFHIAMTLNALGREKEAEEKILKFLSLPESKENQVSTATCYGWLIKTQTLHKSPVVTKSTIDFAVKSYPKHPFIWLMVGDYYLYLGDGFQAKLYFNQLLDITINELPDFCSETLLTYWRYQRLGECFLGLGMLQDAKQIFEVILTRFENAMPTLDGLYRTFNLLGETSNSQKFKLRYEQEVRTSQKELIANVESYQIIPYGSIKSA